MMSSTRSISDGASSNVTLSVRTSPHIAAVDGTNRIMLHVVLALLPLCAFATYQFGVAALLVILTAVSACLITEHLACLLTGQATTIGDWSVVITGLLLGLILPPGLPLWMVAAGGVISVAMGKALFGGLGCNTFNPALVGRAILQASFPVAMTTWAEPASRWLTLPASTLTLPMMKPHYDGISAATPLAEWKFNQSTSASSELLLGTVTGSTGETSALLILLGGCYLIAMRIMTWQTPVAILATVGLASWTLHLIEPMRYASPVFMLASGGLMLGAFFMATDMVASPITRLGRLIYGVMIGGLVVLIRVWGGMPEGVMYAILIGNAVSPHIDQWIQPRVYGLIQREASP